MEKKKSINQNTVDHKRYVFLFFLCFLFIRNSVVKLSVLESVILSLHLLLTYYIHVGKWHRTRTNTVMIFVVAIQIMGAVTWQKTRWIIIDFKSKSLRASSFLFLSLWFRSLRRTSSHSSVWSIMQRIFLFCHLFFSHSRYIHSKWKHH